MKDKIISLFALMGIARSVAETKAEKGSLEESDVETLTQAIKDRDDYKTKLDASLVSELKLQADLTAEQKKVSDLTAAAALATEEKTKVDGELATAKAVLEGRAENPYKKETDPQGAGKENEFLTSTDLEAIALKEQIEGKK